jgi:NAD-dependent dihydropyrimidine dehydrogenase PreA subunit
VPSTAVLRSVAVMTYVIGTACADVMHKSCVQECPVDCIYEGARTLYINPDECVDCGACKPACEAERSTTKPIYPKTSRNISPTMPRSSVKPCQVETVQSGRRAGLRSSDGSGWTRHWSQASHVRSGERHDVCYR